MKRLITVVVLAVTVMAGNVFADTVVVQWVPGIGNPVYTNQYSNSQGGAGQYQIITTSSSDPTKIANSTDLLVYCFELAQNTTTASVTYDIIDPKDAPVPNNPPIAPMDIYRANLLKHLYKEQYAGATSVLQQTAFQLAVWEIVHEQTGTAANKTDDSLPTYYSLSDTTGSFYAIGASAGAGSAAALADTWLAALQTTGKRSVVYALTNKTYQDFLYPGDGTEDTEVPSPTGLVSLIGLGLMGLVGLRRRRGN